MVDVANIGFIDPHPESNRSHHDLVGLCHEPFLHPRTILGVHTRMIRLRIQSGVDASVRNVDGRLLQRHIHDR